MYDLAQSTLFFVFVNFYVSRNFKQLAMLMTDNSAELYLCAYNFAKIELDSMVFVFVDVKWAVKHEHKKKRIYNLNDEDSI